MTKIDDLNKLNLNFPNNLDACQHKSIKSQSSYYQSKNAESSPLTSKNS